jgi:hypothetical protein
VLVGPGQAFDTHTTYGGAFMALGFAYGSGSFQDGPWVNATGRYLGLKFLINGRVHYGWARLTVNSFHFTQGEVLLTGYAYETEPNTKIRTGQESGHEVGSNPAWLIEPGSEVSSLGLLARGADGVVLWRRREQGLAF